MHALHLWSVSHQWYKSILGLYCSDSVQENKKQRNSPQTSMVFTYGCGDGGETQGLTSDAYRGLSFSPCSVPYLATLTAEASISNCEGQSGGGTETRLAPIPTPQ